MELFLILKWFNKRPSVIEALSSHDRKFITWNPSVEKLYKAKNNTKLDEWKRFILSLNNLLH